jgi:hypothetical protein
MSASIVPVARTPMHRDKPCRPPATAAALRALLALLTLAACTADGADDVLRVGDPLWPSRSERTGTVPPELPSIHDLGYFTIAPDPRLCPSPLCGGFWVTRVNRSATVCADGTLASSCYVAELDLSWSGLSDEQEAVVRGAAGHLVMQGSIRTTTIASLGNLGVFRGRNAWIGHADVTPTGTFYRVRDTAIECIAYPCENVQLSPLNRRGPTRLIAGIDLGGVSADAEDGYAELGTPQGLIAAGELVPVSGPGGNSFELRSSEYYVRVVPELALCGAGRVRACGHGHFCDFGGKAQCGRAEAPGVCEPRPQACIELFDPVCGCDAITYGNACAANAAGVGVDHAGPCR